MSQVSLGYLVTRVTRSNRPTTHSQTQRRPILMAWQLAFFQLVMHPTVTQRRYFYQKEFAAVVLLPNAQLKRQQEVLPKAPL